jgi:hypothetical protein
MALRNLLVGFLVWAVYPAWLAAGFVDYLSHRRTHIDRTSGPTESWFHLAQFASLAIPFFLVVFLEVTPLVIAMVAGSIVLHTALSMADVAYTDGRRYISPVEQHVHAFMVVLPVVAAAIIALLNWDAISGPDWALRPKPEPLPVVPASLLVGSYLVLAGAPIVEELIRTSRRFRDHQVEDGHQRRERNDAEAHP